MLVPDNEKRNYFITSKIIPEVISNKREIIKIIVGIVTNAALLLLLLL